MPDPFAQYAAGAKDDPFAAFVKREEPAKPQPLIGHPLTASDETPSATDKLINGFVDNPLIQGAAHPQSLGDFASLLLPQTPESVARVVGAAARPVIAPVARGAAAVIDNVPAIAKKVLPFKADAVSGWLRTTADAARDANMGITRGATPSSQFTRSTDSTARALAPVAEEALPVPSHLDLSQPVRAGALTPEQMAEREGANYARSFEASQPAPVTRSAGVLRTRVQPIAPVPSHGPSVAQQIEEQAAQRARQILPEIPPVSGRVPTGHGTQPDNLLDLVPESSDVAPRPVMTPETSPLQQPRIAIGAEKVGRANGMTTGEVRQQAGPVLGEARGEASPVFPQGPFDRMADTLKAMKPEDRLAYVMKAGDVKTQAQLETIRRVMAKYGLVIPAAATIEPSVRDLLLQQMRRGVTGSEQQ